MKRLSIQWEGNIFQVGYENISKYAPPEVQARVGETVVTLKRFLPTGDGLIPIQGKTKDLWVDDNGTTYDSSEVKYYYEYQLVEKIPMTKMTSVTGMESLDNYLNKYVIDKYYILRPSDNEMEKEENKKQAIDTNRVAMYKFWKFLKESNAVARITFNASSASFISSDAYIRAIENEQRWALEMGVFKEEKMIIDWADPITEEVVTVKKSIGIRRI